MPAAKPRVLLTNDDGPPGPDSPYILGLYRHMTEDLGWDVKVVVPSSQKSWIGNAFQIHDSITGRYLYPTADGSGEISETPRPCKADELAEFVLLDGTPSTCANIGLYNLYPDAIDLVISGPNFGRNTSGAFTLSSGTIGAAISSSLTRIRSIAISYGHFGPKPIPTDVIPVAHRQTAQIISHLWENWGRDPGGIRNGEVDLYSINVPILETLLKPGGPEVYWTTIWRNGYSRLFKMIPPADSDVVSTDSVPEQSKRLLFKFAPNLANIVSPTPGVVPVGSDAWAMMEGHISVTALCATFAEPPSETAINGKGNARWKLKL